MKLNFKILRTAVCRPFFVPILFLLTSPIFAQFEILPIHREINKNITALETRLASQKLQKLDNSNGFNILLKNFNLVTQIAAEENLLLYKQHKGTLDKNLEALAKLPNNSPYKKLLEAELYIHWSFLSMYLGDRVLGLIELKKAYSALKEIEANHKEFNDYKKSLGLLYILLDLVPEEYKWAPEVIGLNGNINKGLSYLDTCIAHESFFAQEAMAYKVIVNAYALHHQKEALKDLSNSNLFESDNILTSFIKANLLYKNRENTKALNILKTLEITPNHCSFNTLTYAKAESYLFAGEYEIAAHYFREFLNNQIGKNYIKSSILKLYFCNILSGKYANREEVVKEIKSRGQDVIEPDKYALHYIQHHDNENLHLLKARFLFDGGYYNRTIESITNVKFENKDLPEYHYRLGRCYQELKQFQKASEQFAKCIDITPKNSKEYFAPNSYLQLGLIAEELGKPKIAIQSYQLVLSYKNYDYKDSIRAKALARLSELEK